MRIYTGTIWVGMGNQDFFGNFGWDHRKDICTGIGTQPIPITGKFPDDCRPGIKFIIPVLPLLSMDWLARTQKMSLTSPK